MPRHLLATFLVAAAVLTGCARSDTEVAETTTTAQTGVDADLTHIVVHCAGLDPELFPPGELTTVTVRDLGKSQCATEDGAPFELGGDTLTIVPSAVDRNTMVVTNNEAGRIAINVEVPDDSCERTEEWRGTLAVVFAGVDDGTTVELTDVPVACEN